MKKQFGFRTFYMIWDRHPLSIPVDLRLSIPIFFSVVMIFYLSKIKEKDFMIRNINPRHILKCPQVL